jgi:hypothetical protein
VSSPAYSLRSGPIGLSFWWLCFVVAPPLLYVATPFSAMSYGLLLSLGMFLLFFPSQCLTAFRMARVNNFAFFTLTALLLTHVVVLGNREAYPIVAAFSIVVMVAAAALCARVVLSLPLNAFKRLIIVLAVLLLFVGVIGQSFYIQALGFGAFPKAIFPFAEPGHFVLGTSAILLSAAMFAKLILQLFFVGTVFFLGLSSPSLLLVCLSFLMAVMVAIRRGQRGSRLARIFLLMVVFAPTAFFLKTDSEYFFDRLAVLNTENISSLVYLQGFEIARDALKDSMFFGLGFEHIPSNARLGSVADQIYLFNGEDKNRHGAGFLGARLVAEFGVLGVILLIAYFQYLYRSAATLLRGADFQSSSTKKTYRLFNTDPAVLFSHASIVAFSIEMFLRGESFFSTGTYFFLVALFILKASQRVPQTRHTCD